MTDIVTRSKNLPPRVVCHGTAGVGKTSFGAYAPRPVFACSQLETGIESLKDAGLVPEEVGLWPEECRTWQDALAVVQSLQDEEHPYKTLVFDVLNGFEHLCHQFVCARDYGGKWTSFQSYHGGYEVALGEWRQLLIALDKLRETKRMLVILLAHTKVAPFRNPEGADYDRYQPDLHKETWAVTYGWADIVLFANYETFVKEERGKRTKGEGGDNRFLYTRREAAFDAKHRHGLPAQIDMGKNGKEAWDNFYQAFKAGNKKGAAV